MPFYLLVRLILHLVASDGGSTKPRHEVCTDSLQCAVEVSGSGFDSGYATCGIFSLLRRRLGRFYRRNAGPHVTLAQTQVREHTPFEAALRPTRGDPSPLPIFTLVAPVLSKVRNGLFIVVAESNTCTNQRLKPSEKFLVAV